MEARNASKEIAAGSGKKKSGVKKFSDKIDEVSPSKRRSALCLTPFALPFAPQSTQLCRRAPRSRTGTRTLTRTKTTARAWLSGRMTQKVRAHARAPTGEHRVICAAS